MDATRFSVRARIASPSNLRIEFRVKRRTKKVLVGGSFPFFDMCHLGLSLEDYYHCIKPDRPEIEAVVT